MLLNYWLHHSHQNQWELINVYASWYSLIFIIFQISLNDTYLYLVTIPDMANGLKKKVGASSIRWGVQLEIRSDKEILIYFLNILG